MTRLLVYLFLFGVILYFVSVWNKNQNQDSESSPEPSKSRRWFRGKRTLGEVWIQVYETASMEEARALQARLQEEDLECVLYEQGKKDIHGSPLKGVGIAVPKTEAPHAQRIIAQMPV